MTTSFVAPAGPVDIMVVGFEGELRPAAIVSAIGELVTAGTVRILDVLLVEKADDGSVVAIDVDSTEGSQELLGFPCDLPGLLGEEDAVAVAEELPAGTSALMIAWENLWASHVGAAIREAGGQMLAYERVPAGDIEAVLEAVGATNEEETS